MNTVLLHPTDVLFFRDGRPMSGASSGHGAAWPLPTVINLAFHAALHRAGFSNVHRHVPGRSSQPRNFSDDNRRQNGRVFGGLTTAGPFPVKILNNNQVWYFPRPADADGTGRPALLPVRGLGHSSLPTPLRYPIGQTRPPSKKTPPPWWSTQDWQHYLQPSSQSTQPNKDIGLKDSDFSDTEHAYGIGIDPETGSVVDRQFYSAHYLRLQPDCAMGVFTEAHDKGLQEDLITKLLRDSGRCIITGGQQRVCTAECQHGLPLPLPAGPTISGTRVKWVLLTPALFPAINDHPGGWLPSWVHTDGSVQLLDGPGKNAALRRKSAEGQPIRARLVAAITGKPVAVTGYALPDSTHPDRPNGGAKSTHLAVPAGSVYFFEADSPEDATKLAHALNWHGQDSQPATTIRNRRSTLMGEKGFGLGICAPWDFLPQPTLS